MNGARNDLNHICIYRFDKNTDGNKVEKKFRCLQFTS